MSSGGAEETAAPGASGDSRRGGLPRASESEEEAAAPGASSGRRWKRARWIARGAFLAAAVAMLWPLVPGAQTQAVVPALSPFVALGSVLATGALHALAWLGSLAAIAALLRHRWFCRWVCPTGTCADGATSLGRRLGRRSARIGSPGQWILWITLGGAALGYPLLLWLDPLALIAGPFRLLGAGSASDPAAWCGAAGLIAVLAISLLWPNLWCGRICPLGAFQDLIWRLSRVSRAIFRRSKEAENAPPASRGGPLLARRAALGALIGAAWAGAPRWARASMDPPLRPPGALGEREFLGICIRCGSCSRACPAGIIESDLGKGGIASFLTPVISFRGDYCREDCVRCTEVCPSGALARLSIEEKPRASIGRARVDMDICLLADGRECSACRVSCPYEAIRYVWSEEDYTLTPRIDPERCNGCGACEVACPTEPRKAIAVAR